MSALTLPNADAMVLSKRNREETMRAVKLSDIKAGTWLFSDRVDEVQSRRRLIVQDSPVTGKVLSVSDTGYIMIAACDPEVLFRHYAKGWKVEK